MSFKDLFIIKLIHKVLGKKIKVARNNKPSKSKRNRLIFLGDNNLPESKEKWKQS